MVSQKTKLIEGNRTPITWREFRCLDKDCQQKIDKDTAVRNKTFEDRRRRV